MKGDLNDECNRATCQKKPATHYNHSTRKHYCVDCALIINLYNKKDAFRIFGHDLCTPVVNKEQE